MTEWFYSLDSALKMYWIIAGVTSLVFIIQMVMTLIGMDAHDGLDADFDGDMDAAGPFQLFSLRNLINFLLGFGWGGVCFYEVFSSKLVVGIVAFFVGLIFLALFFVIIKQLMKLSQDNTFKIDDTLGKTADVYLTIPAEKSGKGKIQISVKGAFHEINALTEGERIPTGGKAKVTEIIDNQTVLVTNI